MKRYHPTLILPTIAAAMTILVLTLASQPCDADNFSDSTTTTSSSSSSSSSDVLMHSLNILSENEEEEKIIMALSCQQEEEEEELNDNDNNYKDEDNECDDPMNIVVSEGSDREWNMMDDIIVNKDSNASHPKKLLSRNHSTNHRNILGRREPLTVKKKTKTKTKKRIIRKVSIAKEKKVDMIQHHPDSSVLMKQGERNPESHAFTSKSTNSITAAAASSRTDGSSNMDDSLWKEYLKRIPREQKDPQTNHHEHGIRCQQMQQNTQHENEFNASQQPLLQTEQENCHVELQRDSHGINTSISVASSKNSHHPLRLHTTRTGTNLIIPASVKSLGPKPHEQTKEEVQKQVQKQEDHIEKLLQQQQLQQQQQQQQQLQQQQQQQQQQVQQQLQQQQEANSKPINTKDQPQQSITQVQPSPKKSVAVQQRHTIKPSTSSYPTTMSLTTPWARKFISSRPKDALLPIPREFLSDGFNLVHVAPIVERAVEAMKSRGEIIQSQPPSKVQVQPKPIGQGQDIGQHKDGHVYNPDLIDGENKLSAGLSNACVVPSSVAESSLHHMSLYKAALRLILQEEEEMSDNRSIAHCHAKYSSYEIQKAAEVLYILVHARYASSPRGLDTIKRMFQQQISNRDNTTPLHNVIDKIEPIFGRCSRLPCDGMPLLPIGMSDCYDIGGKGGMGRRAMRYCPCCREMFYLWDSKVDGAAWGTSFAHLFLMVHGSDVFGSLLVRHPSRDGNIDDRSSHRVQQQPRRTIFGFPLHPSVI
jgi:hypothetical protein